MISVYVTFPDLASANEISKKLLEKGLIACSNIVEGRSIYNWEGKTIEEPEIYAFMKSQESRWEEIKAEIEQIHPFDVPCIVRFDVDSIPSYRDWVKGETQ